MPAIVNLTSRTPICELPLPAGQPVIVRDGSSRITSATTTYTSVKKTTTAAYDGDNLITSFGRTVEDVV